MANSSTLIVGQGRYAAVAGLNWRPLGADPRTELKTACITQASKHGVLLTDQPDGRPLLGLLPPTAPSKARSLPSGAAWLAAASSRPVILIKALPNQGQYWVVAAGALEVNFRADQVLSESDSAELIDDLLGDAMHQPESERPRLVIDGDRYPKSHMIERWSEQREYLPFEDLVRGSPAQKAQSVRQLVGITPMQWGGVLCVALAIVAVGAGIKAWRKHQQAVEIEAQRLELERQQLVSEALKTQTEVRIAQAVVSAMNEDTATPPPDVIVGACVRALQGFGRDLGGWRVVHADCNPNGNSLAVDLMLDSVQNGGVGTNSTLVDAAARRGLVAAIDLASQRAQVTLPLSAPALRPPLKPVEAPSLTAVQTRFAGRLQIVQQALGDFSFKLSNLEPRAATYVDPAKESANDGSRFAQVPPDRTYRKGTFDIAGRNLWESTSLSLNYPFVTITKFEMNLNGSDAETVDWTMKGHYVSSRL